VHLPTMCYLKHTCTCKFIFYISIGVNGDTSEGRNKYSTVEKRRTF